MKYINKTFEKIIFEETNNDYILAFNNCKLIKSDFRKTKLDKIDFSTCDISEIMVNIEDLKGLIVNSYQAITLSTLLGLKIKD